MKIQNPFKTRSKTFELTKSVEGVVHPNMKIWSWFTHDIPCVIFFLLWNTKAVKQSVRASVFHSTKLSGDLYHQAPKKKTKHCINIMKVQLVSYIVSVLKPLEIWHIITLVSIISFGFLLWNALQSNMWHSRTNGIWCQWHQYWLHCVRRLVQKLSICKKADNRGLTV